MDINKLVSLLENEKTWKDTNIFKKQLSNDDPTLNIEELISNLEKIINDKKQKPMARLGALRLLKACLEAGNDFFNLMIAESSLLRSLIDYAKIKPNTNIFSSKPDKRESQISATFFTYIVEGFLFWSQWFPESKFKEYFDQLKKTGVKIPDTANLQLFKIELIGLYVNGQFQKPSRGDDAANQQKLQQSQAGGKPQAQQQQLKQSQTPTQGGPQAQKVSVQEIQERIAEYDSIVEILIDMMRNNDEEVDLQMFTEQLNQFSRFMDNLFKQHLEIDDKLQETILDKGEQCNDIYSLIEQNQAAQINYQQMKNQILQLCDKNPSQKQQEDNQKHIQEQQEYLRQQQEEQEHQEKLRHQHELEEQRRQEEEKIRREKEERRKQEEKQQMEDKRKQEEKQHQEELTRQKKQKEEEDQKQLQMQRQKEQEEHQRQQQLQRQKEQEEQARLKALEEEKLRKQQEQQQQEEQRRQFEAQKKSQMMQHHNIPEDQGEYDDEEERKSAYERNKKASQSKVSQSQHGQGLYSNPEMLQLKNQNVNPEQQMSRFMQKPSNAPSSTQQKPNQMDSRGNFGAGISQNPNPDQLMGFDQDDDFMYDSDIKQKQNNVPHQSQLPQGVSNVPNQSSQVKQQIPQLQQQPQFSNVSHGSQMKSSDIGESSNNQPYASMGQAKKNPFTNQPSQIPSNQQQNSIPQAKSHGNYFGDEEFYEPQAVQVHQTKIPSQAPFQMQNIPQQQLRDSQRVDFDVSKSLDDDDEEEEHKYNYQGTANKAYNSSIQQSKKQSQNSKLDQSDNLDNDETQRKNQIQSINSTIAPKTKPREDAPRLPANPNLTSPQNSNPINLPFTKLEASNKTISAYPFNNNKSNIPSGFEQVSFNQAPSLKSQINQSQDLKSSAIKDFNPDYMNQSKFVQALHNYDDKSHIQNTHDDRQLSQQSFTDGRRVPIFSKDKQINGELSQIKYQLNELRREKDIEISKLQSQLTQISIKNRDLEGKLSQKNQEEGQLTRVVGQEKMEMERRLQEKDKTIFQQKQFIEQQSRDMEQQRSIIKQYEQQKIEQQQILIDKKKQMEDETQKTRSQLQDYINTTQKAHNNHLEQMQKNLNKLEDEVLRYQQDLQQRELENSEMRNELRLLKSKESNFNSNYIREKDAKIQELRSKIEVLNQEIGFRDDKIKDLQQEQLSLKKGIDDIKEEFATTESQIQIYKENIVQKDIEINQIKQIVFEKDQQIYQKEQLNLQLEHSLSKKKEIIEQFKGSSESQIKKFHERIEEQEQEIKNLQRDRADLENRIDSLGIQHREDIDRIIQASQLSEEEKRLFKSMMEENDRLKGEKQMQTLKDQNYQNQINQLQKTITHLKKENEMQEQNMEDMVLANNLITKKLYERDEQFIKEQEMKERDLELKERKYNTEIKYTRQAFETLKLEKQRRETDLQRNVETLRKENELLLNNLKTKSFLSPDRQSRSQIFSPMVKYEPDYTEIDRATNTNSLHDRATADRLIYNSNGNLQGMMNPYSQNNDINQFVSPSKRIFDAYQSPDELQSNNLFSMNYQNNPASLNQSTHSLKPKKQYPKNFMGKEVSFNPTYFSYLSADKSQMYRFKKSCLKNKMAIYQDNYLNVGIITETKDIDGKTFLLVSLFFENKSLNSQFQNVQISYDGDQSITVYKKPTSLPDVFKENSQHQQQIITEFNEMPYKIIQCTVKYTINGNLNQAIFPLPNTVNKYITPSAQTTLEQINTAFQDYAHIMLRSEEINVDKNIASSQYDYTNYFPSFSNLGNVDGLVDYQCIGGQLYLKNIDTNIWLKINYNKKDHKAIFQLVFDNVVEDYTQNMIRYLLQTYMMIFKE